jgi:hypothetical protein
MIDFILSYPSFFMFQFGLVLACISGSIIDNPSCWKIWKYANISGIAGLIIMLLGLGMSFVS